MQECQAVEVICKLEQESIISNFSFNTRAPSFYYIGVSSPVEAFWQAVPTGCPGSSSNASRGRA